MKMHLVLKSPQIVSGLSDIYPNSSLSFFVNAMVLLMALSFSTSKFLFFIAMTFVVFDIF